MTQTTQTRDKIIKMLKDRGCRMTKQRRILLDIILEDNCSSCKEIYYRASKKDKSIGTATVYRCCSNAFVLLGRSVINFLTTGAVIF